MSRIRIACLLGLIGLAGCAQRAARRDLTMTREDQDEISPAGVLLLAKAGNRRFMSGEPYDRDVLYDQRETASGQYPLAIVLSCIDSRAPAEYVFEGNVSRFLDGVVPTREESSSHEDAA